MVHGLISEGRSAQLVAEGESSLIDVRVFDLDRFARGETLQNTCGGNRA